MQLKTEAYINYGRWVADCPLGCNNAVAVSSNNTFECCGRRISVRFPEDSTDIFNALLARPIRNRNWYPKDHFFAICYGIPHGQTVEELDLETIEHLPNAQDVTI
jgi:hypothetical protein